MAYDPLLQQPTRALTKAQILALIAGALPVGGVAPANALYLTLALDATLTNERLFTPTDGLVAVDGGANAAYTLRVSDLYHPFLLMGG